MGTILDALILGFLACTVGIGILLVLGVIPRGSIDPRLVLVYCFIFFILLLLGS